MRKRSDGWKKNVMIDDKRVDAMADSMSPREAMDYLALRLSYLKDPTASEFKAWTDSDVAAVLRVFEELDLAQCWTPYYGFQKIRTL